MSERYVFEGARVVDPAAGMDEVRDVVVADGVIAGTEEAEGAERIDARGLVLAPGLVDLHAHLREPGDEHKETIATGTRAAAAGGFTAVAAMANTEPVTDHAAIVHEVRDLAAAAGICDVFPVGAITKGLEGSRSPRWARWSRRACGSSPMTGTACPRRGCCATRSSTPRRSRSRWCSPSTPRTRRSWRAATCTRGLHSSSLGLAGRPAEAEEIVVARDLALARATGGRLHLCHLSSARAVELVRRAKAEGVRVTAEVTPHHLVFTDEDLRHIRHRTEDEPAAAVAEDREALRAGVADGTIDAIATDHAPHAVEEKDMEFDLAPPGTIGLETALAAVLT